MQSAAHSGQDRPRHGEPAGQQEALPAADVRARLEFLSTLGHGLLESGETTGQTERSLRNYGHKLGLQNLVLNSFGRMLLLEAATADGGTVSISGAARSLDAIDCTRSRELNRVAYQAVAGEHSQQTDTGNRLASATLAVQRLRDTVTPWWVVALGLVLLAFFISMQIGVSWQAWVSAALAQAVTSAMGLAISPLKLPKVFAIALQASAAGAFATVLVQLGFVDPVGAAAAIAVNWLLLLPLPQLIGAVTDAIDADYLSSLTRIASVVVAAGGIGIGGALTFTLGQVLGMAHPKLDALPSLPWYLVLVFSALGAAANAFANGGRLSLVRPAIVLGLITAAVNQALLHLVGLPPVWASSLSAIVLGLLSAVLVVRTGYPAQALALMGITGALLPGIPVFFGILQEMGGGSGLEQFGTAAAVCIGIGAGVALGVHLSRMARKER
ncbi:threonine/serine exporter family protein [Psychromicrobium xiongbiense]|uniref:threonine/serine exporter family protein n=1 Tax=Psychromicrobium xiongbiense TaxID=3051184 RepID=UPI0025565DA3|nr:threonine/serine exporter family protein [Psychromicrobium sp. YIM S02556]